MNKDELNLMIQNEEYKLMKQLYDAEKKKEKAEPWRTVHRSGDGPPIKNQGGQGSYRFGIKSSFRMI